MWYNLLVILLVKCILIDGYDIMSVKPFEEHKFVLNENQRYIIYEFNNENKGTIYCYFKNGNLMSTRVTVYYDNETNINFDENNNIFLDYEEQGNLYQTANISFSAHIGKMYFVISNFNRDYDDCISIINNLGYYDITNMETFRYLYKFEKTNKNNITFSFDNNKKKKKYLYYQLKLPNDFHDKSIIKTKTSNIRLIIDKSICTYCGLINLTQFKNETINIQLVADYYFLDSSFNSLADNTLTGYVHQIFNSFELLIYYSDYYRIFPIKNEENSIQSIPSLNEQSYFIFVDISKAYKYIYLTVKLENVRKIVGQFYFYDSNDIPDIEKALPRDIKYRDGTNISSYSQIYDDFIEIKVEKKDKNSSCILFQMKTSYDSEYKVNFYKSLNINEFKNITIDLKNEINYSNYQIYNLIIQ